MAQILNNIYDWYRDLMDNQSDPRVADWPMMSSPFPTLGLCIFYAYFSKSLAPKLMEKRKPMDLRNTLYLQSGWGGHYSFRCQPVDYSDNPLALRMARTCWWYYVSKFTEFFDTLFFILRKKTQHVSTLHVIHHGCMPFSVWMGMKFAPGGHSTFFAMLNSFVHIVMYFYYMVAALGPQYQKYIWWKKYLTAFQMAQFVAIFTHQFQLLFTECDYPKGFMVWIGLHGVMFLFLFSDFYKQSYNKRVGRVKREADALLAKSHANGKLHNGDVVNNNQGACMDECSIQLPSVTGSSTSSTVHSLRCTNIIFAPVVRLTHCSASGIARRTISDIGYNAVLCKIQQPGRNGSKLERYSNLNGVTLWVRRGAG
uniref:Elongation of very long chain fatty acids protein n=1 Tax=Anopheles culicifacies TaxID=139723 RepID=A0A182MV26_9DIPT